MDIDFFKGGMIMKTQNKSLNLYWKLAAIFLFMFVCAQTAIIYYGLSKKNNSSVVQVPEGDAARLVVIE